jgi:NADH-quinone oxidoreductase subunit G
MSRVDSIAFGTFGDITKLAKGKVKAASRQFVSPVSEFYLTNPIARASAVMGECAATAAGLRQAAE